jgi:hypothetical protein
MSSHPPSITPPSSRRQTGGPGTRPHRPAAPRARRSRPEAGLHHHVLERHHRPAGTALGRDDGLGHQESLVVVTGGRSRQAQARVRRLLGREAGARRMTERPAKASPSLIVRVSSSARAAALCAGLAKRERVVAFKPTPSPAHGSAGRCGTGGPRNMLPAMALLRQGDFSPSRTIPDFTPAVSCVSGFSLPAGHFGARGSLSLARGGEPGVCSPSRLTFHGFLALAPAALARAPGFFVFGGPEAVGQTASFPNAFNGGAVRG